MDISYMRRSIAACQLDIMQLLQLCSGHVLYQAMVGRSHLPLCSVSSAHFFADARHVNMKWATQTRDVLMWSLNRMPGCP